MFSRVFGWLSRCAWILAMLVVAGVCGDSALAQGDRDLVEPGEEMTLPARPAFTLSLRGNYRHDFDTDLDGSDASFSVNSYIGNLLLGGIVDERLGWRTAITFEYSDYRFENAATLVPGLNEDEPFDSFQAGSASFGLDYRINRQWMVSGTGFVRSAYEEGADFGEGLTGGGFGFVTYTFNDDFTLGFGAGATTRMEDDVLVLPYLFVRWQIAEEWLLRSDGLGARLSWTPAPEYELFLRARFGRDEWRLDRNRGDASKGVLRDRRVPIGLGIDWRPIEGLTVSGEVSVLVYRELEFLNDGGNTVSEEKIDEIMPALGLRVEWRF